MIMITEIIRTAWWEIHFDHRWHLLPVRSSIDFYVFNSMIFQTIESGVEITNQTWPFYKVSIYFLFRIKPVIRANSSLWKVNLTKLKPIYGEDDLPTNGHNGITRMFCMRVGWILRAGLRKWLNGKHLIRRKTQIC